MTSYDIHPEQVQGILKSTLTLGTELSHHAEDIDTAKNLAYSAGGSNLVGDALTGLINKMGPTVKFCFQRTSDAVSGCSRAANYYIAGDDAMAKNAAVAATKAQVPSELPGLRGAK